MCPNLVQVGAQIAQVIARLALMSAGVDSEFPFTMVVDDPSGNSFVENPSAPNRDPALTVRGGGGVSGGNRWLRGFSCTTPTSGRYVTVKSVLVRLFSSQNALYVVCTDVSSD